VKDEIARKAIYLLSRRIWQLRKELEALKIPHPKGCKCEQCTGYVVNWFDTAQMHPEVTKLLSTGE